MDTMPPLPPATSVDETCFRLAETTETASTNADLVEAARAGERPFLALRADFQTGGRGRRDRKWDAPPGSGLLMSVFFPRADADEAGAGPHLVASCLGLAAQRACQAAGADVLMKWPNDLVGPVLDDGTLPKLAGVLGEVVSQDQQNLGVVVGIGLNLRPVPTRAAELGRTVAVLDELTNQRISPTEAARLVLCSLEVIMTRLDQPDGPRWLRTQLIAASAVIGREVDVKTESGMVTGVAIDFEEDGRLVVDAATGKQAMSVGDVVSARVRV